MDSHFRAAKGHRERLACEDPLDLRELKEVEVLLDQKVPSVSLAFRDSRAVMGQRESQE